MMDILLTIIGILILLFVAVLLLRLRLHVELSEDRRTIFFGLGRSGPFIDLATGQGRFRLFGFGVRTFSVGSGNEKPEEQPEQPPADDVEQDEQLAEEQPAEPDTRQPEKPGLMGWYRRVRHVPWETTWRLASHSTKASGRYVMRLFRGTRLEELDARIRGGFDSPDETGKAYGYFQAVASAVPQIGRHVQFYPDFTGQSLSGSLRIGLALPLYRFVGSTLLFLWDLPLREVIRLAIGKKKGADDVK